MADLKDRTEVGDQAAEGPIRACIELAGPHATPEPFLTQRVQDGDELAGDIKKRRRVENC